MTADPFVLDAIRDTFRCQACRAEVHARGALGSLINRHSDFVEAHLHCHAVPTPAPVDVPLTPGMLRRDHLGLWSSWQLLPGLSAWRVHALTLEDAVAQLQIAHHTLQQRVTLLGSTLPRDAAHLEFLVQVLASEGHTVDVTVAVAG